MAAEPTAVVVPGECGWCGHRQFTHKLGKRGCKELGCPCGRYEPPKNMPVADPALQVDPASPVPGEVVDGPEFVRPVGFASDIDQAERDELTGRAQPAPAGVRTSSTCAYPNGEDEGEHDHAMCEDAVAERAEQAAESCGCPRSRQLGTTLAEIEQMNRTTRDLAAERDEARVQRDQATGEAEDAQRRADRLAGELRSLEAETTAVTAQRDQAVADIERLGRELIAARREAKAAVRAKERVRDELDAATRARLRLQEDLDEAILTGLTAATNVLYRYPAWQCETCGSRYSHQADHEHPLTAVDVLIVRRKTEAPAVAEADTNRKEN